MSSTRGGGVDEGRRSKCSLIGRTHMSAIAAGERIGLAASSSLTVSPIYNS
jgi:hypothetical protein